MIPNTKYRVRLQDNREAVLYLLETNATQSWWDQRPVGGTSIIRSEDIASVVPVADSVKCTRWKKVVRVASSECSCHREGGSHELCCGHPDGRDPNCPQHGDGYSE